MFTPFDLDDLPLLDVVRNIGSATLTPAEFAARARLLCGDFVCPSERLILESLAVRLQS